MKRRSKEKSEETVGSHLLTAQENEKVEDLLGRRRVSLCTTVVQLFKALPYSSANWSLQHTGVICFVKDNPQRSYFIRLYSITEGKLVWEQELFNQFNYCRVRAFFHTFQSDECQVGLNFANEEEAENFYLVVDEKINQRIKQLEKRQGKGSTSSRDHDVLPPLPPNCSGSQNQFPLGNSQIQNQAPSSKSKKEKKEKEKKSKKKSSKLSKELIGAPSGFTHVRHCGMNSIDPDLMQLLSRAGISEADMRDSETSQLIYDVIERSGGMEAVKKELNHQECPPPPPNARRTSLPPVPPGSSSAHPSSQGRFGPLPPRPGQTPSTGSRSTSVRALPPTPSGGRTGPPPPPKVEQGGRRGPLPLPSGSHVAPSVRSGTLPPVPGGHSSLPPRPSSGQGGTPSSATFTRSGPLPPVPGRGSGSPSRPPSIARGASMPSGHSARSVPPLPGRRSDSPSQPPCDEFYLLPPPALPEDLPPPPASDFPLSDSSDLPPPPPLPSECYPPPPSWENSDMVPPPQPVSMSKGAQLPPSANSRIGGPPPPPPPPAPAPKLESDLPPPSKVSGGGGGGGGRGELLNQIRIGTKLKTVTAGTDPPSSAALDSGEGIVGALMMVMQKRSKVIHSSSDEGGEFDDDEDDDDEWD